MLWVFPVLGLRESEGFLKKLVKETRKRPKRKQAVWKTDQRRGRAMTQGNVWRKVLEFVYPRRGGVLT